MSVQNILLLLAGLINLTMSILVFSRGVKHNKINLYFSLLTFFNFLWVIGLFFSRLLLHISELWFLYAVSTYISALAIILFLYLFSIYFPFQATIIKKSIKYFIILVTVFFVAIFFVEGLFFRGFDINDNIYVLYYNNFAYIIYALFFIFIAALVVRNFIRTYIRTESFFKIQIKYLLITIIPGLFFGAYFDLFLCYFGIFDYNWLGPLFTLPMNFMAFYLIFKIKVVKDVKTK